MDTTAVIKLLASMTGVIALILAVAWLLHRSRLLRASQDNAIRLLSVCSLGNRQSLALVECGGERLLLGIGAQSMCLLQRSAAFSKKAAGSCTTQSCTESPDVSPYHECRERH